MYKICFVAIQIRKHTLYVKFSPPNSVQSPKVTHESIRRGAGVYTLFTKNYNLKFSMFGFVRHFLYEQKPKLLCSYRVSLKKASYK